MKPTSVTFDTNVLKYILGPEICDDDNLQSKCTEIKSLIVTGHITPHVSETIFNLEDIGRSARAEYFGSYEPTVTSKIIQTDNPEVIRQSVCISPNTSCRPTSNSHWLGRLSAARELGFLFLSAPRIGMTRNPLLLKSDFGNRTQLQMGEQQALYFDALDFISQLGAGIEKARELGNNYRTNEQTWHEALKNAPTNRVANEIAEWSDGDSIAAHISYKIDLFCTNDNAKSAGTKSIFSANNRNKLKEKYGTKIVNPEELLILINTST